ncbi:MAG: leucine-rich repeat domain-containing protein [Alistipes sp.]|nr:leucine-rich repeat domain-containing protein [Alistipes sp.]
MKRNLLYIALSLVAILLLSGCEKTSNIVLMHNTLTYKSYDQQTIDVRSSDFGAEIIEHYYANGYGIIQFDRPITKISENAFYNCYNLTSITIPDGVTLIGRKAFYNCERLTSITIPDSVTYIGREVFYDCDSLTSITIPDTVNSIEDRAFYDCDSLTSITILDGVTHIGREAFYSCYSLTSITIPDTVNSIGDWAFYSCDSLTSITIPDGVNSIGDRAFSDCNDLSKVYCMATTPPKLGPNAFDENYSRFIIYVPSESVAAYKNASGWCDYADVILGYDF